MRPRRLDLGGNVLPPSLVGVMVLMDRSGSMDSIKGAMEQSFAAFLEQQRALGADGMWLTLQQFNSSGRRTVYDHLPLADIPPLRLAPSGGTPLRDALCGFLDDAQKVIQDASDPTDRLLLVVITDGEENESRLHSWDDVRARMARLDDAECETLWLGTTAAILEAQDQVLTFTQAGATVPTMSGGYGVAYATANLSAGLRAVRTGGSARSMSASFMASHPTTSTAQAPEEMLTDLALQDLMRKAAAQTADEK